MANVIVIAPHPDDETLGCGGTLLKHKNIDDRIHWLIATKMTEDQGFSTKQMEDRRQEIDTVQRQYSFDSVVHLNIPSTQVDTVPMGKLVSQISKVFQEVRPNIVYVPYRGDIHTDHKFIFDAVIACTKSFRYPYVKQVLAYETLSETDCAINPDQNGFQPNFFVNIEEYLAKKIKIMNIYESEIGEFPFPRSEKAIRSLAQVRGAASGFRAAEAFMLLKERWE
jgi:LmbE family N-acetylglucosaminyl deacetylase